VEENNNLNAAVSEACDNVNEYNGAVGIYYPVLSKGNDRFLYRNYKGFEQILLEQIVKNVVQFSNVKKL